MGAGLLRFGTAAIVADVTGVSGKSVERFADSAVSGGVLEGATGGGWRRPAMGWCEAQPVKHTERTQTAHRTRRKNECREAARRWQLHSNAKKCVFESELAGVASRIIFKGSPAS